MRLPQITVKQGVLLGVLGVIMAVVGYLLYATLWRTTVILHESYDNAEQKLLSALDMDRDELVTTRYAQSHVTGRLKDSLTMEIHTHHLIAYQPGQRLRFSGDHAYNICGSGHEWVEFDLVRQSDNTTKLTVDYFENTWLFGSIPVTWRSGRKQERQIISTIFGERAHKDRRTRPIFSPHPNTFSTFTGPQYSSASSTAYAALIRWP